MNIITLFCKIDDFFLAYEKWQTRHCLPETTPPETRGRPRQLHPSEVMTLLIAFHQSGYRTFQAFLRKTRLRLLVRRVSTSGELFSVRSTQERSADASDTLSSCPPR